MTFWYVVIAFALALAVRWVYVTEQIEEVFALTMDPEKIDSISTAALAPGDIIFWEGDRRYFRTITEVNDEQDGGLAIEFDDDLDCSWSVSVNQLDDLIDIYSY